MTAKEFEVLANLWNAVWSAQDMGKVYGQWRDAGHDPEFAIDKAIDALPRQYQSAMREATKIVRDR